MPSERGPSQSPAPTPLSRLGRYTVYEELATGGMSDVYLARRDGSQDFCVIKMLKRSLESSAVAMHRFRREAHVASFLSHPNIARVLGAGVESGKLYIAYEFIPGQMLSAIIDRMIESGWALPVHVSVTITLAALDGLVYAHGLRDADGRPLDIVHRDLSPQNLMISYRGEVKIIDFGVARGNMDTFRTNPGTVVGTPQYMSPEQVSGDDVDARTDLYTIGSVLWEMLTMRQLIPSQPNRVGMFGAVLMSNALAPSALNPHVAPELDQVVLKALAKKPADRYQTAAELKAALDAATSHLPRVSAQELATAVERLFPMERRHVIALAASRAARENGRETLDDVVDVSELTTRWPGAVGDLPTK